MSQPLLAGATVFCVHPVTGYAIYVARRGAQDLLGGIPGGKVDPDEPFQQTARREFFEETGHQLDYISDEPIFSSIATETNALCKVFLGILSTEAWKAFDAEFAGPEGLMVRISHWTDMMSYEKVAFADFNRRFFMHIQSIPELKVEFEKLGLTKVYDEIIAHKIN